MEMASYGSDPGCHLKRDALFAHIGKNLDGRQDFGGLFVERAAIASEGSMDGMFARARLS